MSHSLAIWTFFFSSLRHWRDQVGKFDMSESPRTFTMNGANLIITMQAGPHEMADFTGRSTAAGPIVCTCSARVPAGPGWSRRRETLSLLGIEYYYMTSVKKQLERESGRARKRVNDQRREAHRRQEKNVLKGVSARV